MLCCYNFESLRLVAWISTDEFFAAWYQTISTSGKGAAEVPVLASPVINVGDPTYYSADGTLHGPQGCVGDAGTTWPGVNISGMIYTCPQQQYVGNGWSQVHGLPIPIFVDPPLLSCHLRSFNA